MERMDSYPNNLLMEIYLPPVDNANREEIIKNLDDALDTLSPREKEDTLYHYRDGMTLKWIAEKRGITVNGQVNFNQKILRKLRRPGRIDIIMNGLTFVKMRDKRLKTINELNEKIKNLKKELQILEHCKETGELDGVNLSIDIPLRSVNMSTRLYNALYRAGIHDLNQLANKDTDEIMHYRQMGRTSMKELYELCNKYSIPLKIGSIKF